jgi:Ca2+-binding RTX toxin-like protein
MGGDILLGGRGSDLLEGKKGDDLIDGDVWLNVPAACRCSTTAPSSWSTIRARSCRTCSRIRRASARATSRSSRAS